MNIVRQSIPIAGRRSAQLLANSAKPPVFVHAMSQRRIGVTIGNTQTKKRSSGEILKVANLWFTFLWIILVFPSLFWWKDSILWVILISLWANIVGHFSAYVAGRGEVAQETGHNLTESDMEWIRATLATENDTEATQIIPRFPT